MKLNKRPKINVFMLTYNQEMLVVDSIDSIINQTYTNWELLIGDDCSTDNTVKIIENISDVNGNKHTQKQGKALCISCGNSIDHKTLSASISKNKDREMIAIQIKKQNTRKYILPSIEDKKQERNQPPLL